MDNLPYKNALLIIVVLNQSRFSQCYISRIVQGHNVKDARGPHSR
jgi:hypothetical protein